MTTTLGRLTVLDPTYTPEVAKRGMAARPETLAGKKVGLLANDKRNSEPLLEAIYDVLAERFELGGKFEINKGDSGRPAPPELLDDLATRVDVVLTANGD